MKLDKLSIEELQILADSSDLYRIWQKLVTTEREETIQKLFKIVVSSDSTDITAQILLTKYKEKIETLTEILDLERNAKIRLENRKKDLHLIR